jgi:hypothetical protein
MVEPGTFVELDLAERQVLTDWLARARSFGIDAAIDMKDRDWKAMTGCCIIGVFADGGTVAAWLVVGHDGDWVLANCASGFVSHPAQSLAAVLAMIEAAG